MPPGSSSVKDAAHVILAAPVIGGMLSSLLHILVVPPVLFAWLRERGCPQDAPLLAE